MAYQEFDVGPAGRLGLKLLAKKWSKRLFEIIKEERGMVWTSPLKINVRHELDDMGNEEGILFEFPDRRHAFSIHKNMPTALLKRHLIDTIRFIEAEERKHGRV